MSDIALRLTLYAQQFEDQHAPQNLTVTLREAAAEIGRLRTALREIALGDHMASWSIARAALAEAPQGRTDTGSQEGVE